MQISTATHFGQNGQYNPNSAPGLFALLEDLGVSAIRDDLYWGNVERSPGVYDFDAGNAYYIETAIKAGLDPLVILAPRGNALYQEGEVVRDSAAIDAYIAYVRAVLDRFPGLKRINIGNEVNGVADNQFSDMDGRVSLQERARVYTEVVRALDLALEETHPEVELVAGALHSVPTGYIGYLADEGLFQHIDTLDIHPYGPDPTQLAEILEELKRQLNRLPESERPDVSVTEFGRSADLSDPLSNADYLVKMVAVMAAAGVKEAVWYSLLDEDWYSYADMGIYQNLETPNDMAQAFTHITALMDGASPERLDSPSHVRLYQFTEDTWLIWGAAQDIEVSGQSVSFFDAGANAIAPMSWLTDQPVFVQGEDVTFTFTQGAGSLLTDSFYDFDLHANEQGDDSGWTYWGVRIDQGVEREFLLDILPGQSTGGESWNPYLGNNWARPFFMDGRMVLPVEFGSLERQDERAAMDRYTFADDGEFDFTGRWQVSEATTDGVLVEVRLNGSTLNRTEVFDEFSLEVLGLQIEAGDELDFIVFDNGVSFGDETQRHLRIFESVHHAADSAINSEVLLDSFGVSDQLEFSGVDVGYV